MTVIRLPEAASSDSFEFAAFLYRVAHFIEEYETFIGDIDCAPVTAELQAALAEVKRLGFVHEVEQ